MCGTCGCGEDNSIRISKPGNSNKLNNHHHSHSHNHEGESHSHDHSHKHQHEHTHSHDNLNASSEHDHHHSHSMEIQLEVDILQKNNMLAERNKGYFEAKNIVALNMVSSPGSGKTSILEKTIKELSQDIKFAIIEGDQQTMNDANRIESTGAPVIQINTGSGCHLDADMINKAVKELEPENDSILIIENVGNLVCPSMFQLGESKRIVILSITEGEDKPIKYPDMFRSSDICIINKIDLAPYLDVKIEKIKKYAIQVNHHLEFFVMSAKTGEGMDEWYNWLKNISK